MLHALRVPDSTLDCIDEVLMTTFCNPMDGAALSFTVPILVRGIKDANYELVTCTPTPTPTPTLTPTPTPTLTPTPTPTPTLTLTPTPTPR